MVVGAIAVVVDVMGGAEGLAGGGGGVLCEHRGSGGGEGIDGFAGWGFQIGEDAGARGAVVLEIAEVSRELCCV